MFPWAVGLVFLMVQSASACSPTSDWERFSYEKMMYHFDLVVIGTDLKHIVVDNETQVEDSEFLVTCVLKGDDKGINESITIFRVSPLTSCFFSEVLPGNDYIIGLKRYGDGYIQHMVNVGQKSAFSNTTDNLARALKVCGLEHPRQPNGANQTSAGMFCTSPNSTEKCSSGQEMLTVSPGIILTGFLSIFLWLSGITGLPSIIH